jgi:hypothetical protein
MAAGQSWSLCIMIGAVGSDELLRVAVRQNIVARHQAASSCTTPLAACGALPGYLVLTEQ